MNIYNYAKIGGALLLAAIVFQIVLSSWWSNSEQVTDIKHWLINQESVISMYGSIESFNVVKQTSVLADAGEDNSYDIYIIRVNGNRGSGEMEIRVGNSSSSNEIMSASLD